MEFASSLDIIINETLPALEKVKDSGKVKFIGITGYPLINFRTVLERSKVNIDTVLSYCRCCLHDTELLDYKEYFKKHGIGIVNASPISMGLLSSRGPPSWHPAGELVRNKCKEAADYCQVCQGYVYSKPDKFENATSAAKTDKTFSVHINRFQTVSLSTLKRCHSPRTLARQSRL